jgi:hypothetical protein
MAQELESKPRIIVFSSKREEPKRVVQNVS